MNNNVIQFRPRKKDKADDLQERIERIKASIERINQIMSELGSKPNESKDLPTK